jgi:hypothetical protein
MTNLQETVDFMLSLTYVIGMGAFLIACLRWFIFEHLAELFSSNKD